MFAPPCCPYPDCSEHLDPDKSFYSRHGTYRPACRRRPVPRFRCRACKRTFSRQTFRIDYRDRRPDLNAALFSMTASGVGIRQSARILGLSLRSAQLKLRKIDRHLRLLTESERGSRGAAGVGATKHSSALARARIERCLDVELARPSSASVEAAWREAR